MIRTDALGDPKCGNLDDGRVHGRAIVAGDGDKDGDETGIPDRVARDSFDEAIEAYDDLLEDPTNMLFLLAMGNVAFNLGDDGIYDFPYEAMRQSENFRDRFVTVGGLGGADSETRAPDSAYGEPVDIDAPSTGWRVLMPPHPEDQTWPERRPDLISSCDDDRPIVCRGVFGNSYAPHLLQA